MIKIAIAQLLKALEVALRNDDTIEFGIVIARLYLSSVTLAGVK